MATISTLERRVYMLTHMADRSFKLALAHLRTATERNGHERARVAALGRDALMTTVAVRRARRRLLDSLTAAQAGTEARGDEGVGRLVAMVDALSAMGDDDPRAGRPVPSSSLPPREPPRCPPAVPLGGRLEGRQGRRVSTRWSGSRT